MLGECKKIYKWEGGGGVSDPIRFLPFGKWWGGMGGSGGGGGQKTAKIMTRFALFLSFLFCTFQSLKNTNSQIFLIDFSNVDNFY